MKEALGEMDRALELARDLMGAVRKHAPDSDDPRYYERIGMIVHTLLVSAWQLSEQRCGRGSFLDRAHHIALTSVAQDQPQ